jgi:hypothetical protein
MNPFEQELARRRAAKTAHLTPQQIAERRARALEFFSVSMDGHRLEKLRKISAPLAAWIERKHEANLAAKAKAWEERTAREVGRKQPTTAAPIESAPPSTGHRQSERQSMIDAKKAAINTPAESVQDVAQHIADYEVSPSVDRGRRHTRGLELARRLQRIWRPRTPGDGGWMNNR